MEDTLSVSILLSHSIAWSFSVFTQQKRDGAQRNEQATALGCIRSELHMNTELYPGALEFLVKTMGAIGHE